MGPFDNIIGQPTGSPPTNIFPGMTTDNSGIGQLVHSLGFGSTQEQQSGAALKQGMDQLSALMESNGRDPQRAMLKFVQSPEGQQLMAVPGAFKELTDQFQKAMIPPNPAATSLPQGTTGVITQNGMPMPGGSQQQNPQQFVTGPGQRSDFATNGQFTGKTVQNTTDSQSLDHVITSYGKGMDENTLNMLALGTQGQTPFQQMQLGISQAVNAKLLTPQEGSLALSGVIKIQKDDNIPGRFYVINSATGAIHMQQLGGMMPAPGSQPSLNNNWSSGPGADPSSLSAGPPRPGQPPAPGQQGSNAAPASAIGTPQAMATAKKYNVPQEAIKSDGTIDPVAAYGPSSIIALGAGWPAIMQNNAGIIGRWFDPRNTDATSDLVSKAEIAGDSLKYLSVALASGNTRIKAIIDSVLEMGPEHEHMSDPIYATNQLIQLRNTLEGQARVNQTEQANNMNEGMKGDNALLQDSRRQNDAIQKVLGFLPSTESLQSMQQAIKDGKIQVPSVASAGSTIGRVTGSAISHGAQLLFGKSTTDELNSDVPGTITRIENATPKDLQAMSRMYHGLDPAIQKAFDARIDAARKKNTPAQAPAPSSNFAPAESQGPSTQQFLQNPVRTASNPAERAKQQGKQTPFSSATVSDKARLNNAFSQFGQ